MKKIIFALLVIIPGIGSADLNKKLNEYFDSFGSSSNFSSAEIYNGQKAGYLTGGGVSIRNRVMTTNIATVNLPKFDAGCGGIDIYTGGFSFINGDQIVNTLKNIASNSKGYAFLLGLEVVSPMMASQIKILQDWANKINALNINSCETASQLVGSVLPKTALTDHHICRAISGKKGFMSDYASSRQDCAGLEGKTQTNNSTKGDAAYQHILSGEYNIAWEAIQKQPFLANDTETAEFFMTLMGTVVIRQHDKNTSIDIRPSKISDESFLKTLLEGGKTVVYSCERNDKQCLVLKDKTINIPQNKAWLGRIQNLLIGMQDKCLNDEELSKDEKDLMLKSRLPLYKIVNILTAYHKGYCPIDLYQVSEIVAMDLLIQYLREAADTVRNGCIQLRRTQIYADEIDAYLETLTRSEEAIKYYETRSMHLIDREFQTMQKLEAIEQQIAAEIVLE